ncbi:MAG: hypothetical protein HQL57_05280 [Magnetococcales bacterium]|nr:hypothetical protein [Magnetococcales bacterium]
MVSRKPPKEESSTPLSRLPELSLADAAWQAGVSSEFLERLLREWQPTGYGVDDQGVVRISPEGLLRFGFTLVGHKESQLAMLKLELAALRRAIPTAGGSPSVDIEASPGGGSSGGGSRSGGPTPRATG